MNIFLDVLEWVVLAVAVMLILAGLIFIRQRASAKAGITYGVIFSNLCYLLAMVAILVGDYSPFHLLWLFPASWAAGFFTLIPPFSYLANFLARLYGHIVSVGLRGERGKPEDAAP